MAKRQFFVVLSLLLAVGSQGSQEEKEGNPDITSRQDLMRRYESSIRYWDTNEMDIRKQILKELTVPEEFKAPGCPRIRYPLICDSDGVISENVCYFRMRRRERSNILPIMVFTSTGIEKARSMCDKEVRKP